MRNGMNTPLNAPSNALRKASRCASPHALDRVTLLHAACEDCAASLHVKAHALHYRWLEKTRANGFPIIRTRLSRGGAL